MFSSVTEIKILEEECEHCSKTRQSHTAVITDEMRQTYN